MKRRGSQAIELALALPMLIVLTGGAVDVGRYLYIAERVAAVASEGARAGARAEPTEGESAVAIATAAARSAWIAEELPGTLTVDATIDGAVPSQRITVTASLPPAPYFGFLHLLPNSTTCSRTIRVGYQD